MTNHGMIVWSELMTTEVEKAKAFYANSLGVTFEKFNMTARPDGPTGWFTYIGVDDVDARVKAAEAAGASLCMPVFDVPTVGRIAILQDVTGSIVGWMTPV